MNKPIYIIGHKNPDTDAIVSAIAYAEYKKAKGINAIAGRIGAVSDDTEYLLERFKFEDPIRLFSGKSLINEIDYDKAILINPSLTIYEALNKIIKTDTRTLFIVDKKKNLVGLLSLSNLNILWTADERYLTKLLKTATLENIVKILQAKIIVKADNYNISGKVQLAPSQDDDIKDSDIVITSSINYFKKAIDANANLIILLGDINKFKDLIQEAKKKNINIIHSKLNALKVSKLIYQTPTIDHLMLKGDEVIKVFQNETVEASLNKVSKSRYRSYPIVDDNNVVVGALSRYHLLNYKKKQFVLVDHNEIKQSIDDIEAAEIIEIMDHHRLGGFKTSNPITITTKVVGATNTIIAQKFFDDKIQIDKNLAGLMLGAILSDTLNFMSPTTTDLDKEMANKLEKISKVKSNELYKEIVKHAKSLTSRKNIDILYDDYKNYEVNGVKIGISQAPCKDEAEFNSVKDSLLTVMDEALKTRNLDLIICMLTDPNGRGSYLLIAGDKKDIINEMYPNRLKDDFIPKLMSRKKQLLPEVIKVLS